MRDSLIEKVNRILKANFEYVPLSAAINVADDLLENGVIAPPCNVGDEVYFVYSIDENCEDYIDKGKVYAISQNENTLWFSVRYLSGLRYDHPSRDFGKTVFLTKQGAEKALKGGVE